MADINFINDPSTPRPKAAAGRDEAPVDWTEPKTPGAADAASRREALSMIRQYVKEKEASEPMAAAEQPSKPSATELASEPVTAAQATSRGIISSAPAPSFGLASLSSIISKIKGLFNKKKEPFSGGILATDLIRDELLVGFDWRKNSLIFLFFVLLSGLVLAGVYQGLAYWQDKKIAAMIENTQKFSILNIQIAQGEKGIGDIVDFQKKLEVIKHLLDKHIYWSNFFEFLETSTLTDVTYASFGGDIGGDYVLNGKAKDFKTLADQLRVLKESNLVLRANSTGGKVGQDKKGGVSDVSFDLELKVNPNLFQKN